MKKLFEILKIKNSKRIIENAVIILILLVIVIILINSFDETEEKNDAIPVAITVEKEKTESLEEKLENILSLIEGAGKVKVMISYQETEEKVPLYDVSENITTTEEKDKEGGTRKTETKNSDQKIVFEENGNNKQIFVKQIIRPKVIGVIVIAEGANNIKVKENLINAVSAIIDVPAHHIQIFKM